MKLDRSSDPRYAKANRGDSDFEILQRRAQEQERAAWTIALSFGFIALAALIAAVQR